MIKTSFSAVTATIAFVMPAIAQVAQPNAPAIQIEDAATQLAAQVLPLDLILLNRIPLQEANLSQELRESPQIAKLESRYPGLIAAILLDTREDISSAHREAVMLLQADVAQLYRQRFTTSELAILRTFYASSTGKAMIAASFEAEGETASEVDVERRRKVAAMLQSPTPQVKADLLMIMQGGLMTKLRAAGPEVAALSKRRFDDIAALLQDRIPARIDQIVANYTKSKP